MHASMRASPSWTSSTPVVAPSILSANFAHMGEDATHALSAPPSGAGAHWLHLDVMDGHFAPNLTFGPDLCAALRRTVPGAFLDTHLMVMEPHQYVETFARAGASLLTFHAESLCPDARRVALSDTTFSWACDGPPSRDRVASLARSIRSAGMRVGLALNPLSPAGVVLPHLDLVDMVLVMSVHPGFSGQAFLPVLDKVRAIRAGLRPDQRLEMDGGLSPVNARLVRDAGCDTLVAGNAFFGVSPAGRADVVRAMTG